MALNTCEMWSNGAKTAFFSKNYEKSSSPDPHSLQRLGASPPDLRLWYVWITVHLLTQHVSQFTHFHISTIGSSPPSWTSSSLRGNTRPRLLIFHFTISLPPSKNSSFELSDDVIASDLWFGPPPNQKSWLRLCPIEPRSRNRELTHNQKKKQKKLKNGEFWVRKFINSLIIQRPLDVKAKIWTQHGCL